MPETIEDYYARVKAAVDDEGRLAFPADGIPFWEIFPFESEGLRLRPIGLLDPVEAVRQGEDPTQCQCAESEPDDEWAVWTDEHWKVRLVEESGAPLVLMLIPLDHYDFTSLPKERAAEMGQIMVALGAAIEALPSVARAHVSKWGDGEGTRAHLLLRQADQDPAVPRHDDGYLGRLPTARPRGRARRHARAVIQDLVRSYGGHAVGSGVNE